MTLELRQLRYLIAVAEEGNIGRAAGRLNISQPPLTRQIHALESELGAVLFVRTPKGVELTDMGSIMLSQARNIISLLDQMTEQARRVGRGVLGRLEIGLYGSTIWGVVPAVLKQFREAQPDVRIIVHTMTRTEQIEALRSRRIAVGFNRFVQSEPGITIETILREPIMVALRSDHALATHETIPFNLVAAEPLILFPSGERLNFIDLVLDLFRTAHLKPKISQEVSDPMACLSLIASGFGLAFVAKSVTALSTKGVVYRRLRMAEPPTVDLSCLYREDNESPILQTFLTFVRKVAADACVNVA